MSGRIRSVKPEWLEDELLAAASDEARVLSIGLILVADDYGNGRASIATIAAEVWRYALERDDGANAPEVLAKASRAFRELLAIGFIGTWTEGGQRYFTIRNWARHQRVDKPGKPLVPKPPSDIFVAKTTDSGESRETVATDSGASPESLPPDMDKDQDQRREGKVDAAVPLPAPSKPKRVPGKTAIPADFALTEKHLEHAKSKGYPEWWARNRFDAFVEAAGAKGFTNANWDLALYGSWRREIEWGNTPAKLAHLAPKLAATNRSPNDVTAEKKRLDAEFAERRRRELHGDQPTIGDDAPDVTAAKAHVKQAIGGLF